MNCRLTHIGTACLLIEIGDFRLLTDPVFDSAGGQYFFGDGTHSRKLTNPAIPAADLGEIDLILLSHDQHEDNLDQAGRSLLPKAKNVVTTKAGAKRLGNNTIGLQPWESREFSSPQLNLKVTAVPARHGSLGSYLLVGETTGFILEWDDQKDGALYISGDTIWFNGISEIGKRFKVGTAILHLGQASFGITGPVRFTMNAREAGRFLTTLHPTQVIPIHYEGWSHFRETKQAAQERFILDAPNANIRWLKLGTPVDLGR